ncbi:MAG: hypothetical protein ACRD3O_06340 [Terriglobia bacterium]
MPALPRNLSRRYTERPYDDCRLFYADEIRIVAGLDSAAPVAAYARVPREKFMGPAPWQVASPDMASMAFMGLAVLGVCALLSSRHF